MQQLPASRSSRPQKVYKSLCKASVLKADDEGPWHILVSNVHCGSLLVPFPLCRLSENTT